MLVDIFGPDGLIYSLTLILVGVWVEAGFEKAGRDNVAVGMDKVMVGKRNFVFV